MQRHKLTAGTSKRWHWPGFPGCQNGFYCSSVSQPCHCPVCVTSDTGARRRVWQSVLTPFCNNCTFQVPQLCWEEVVIQSCCHFRKIKAPVNFPWESHLETTEVKFNICPLTTKVDTTRRKLRTRWVQAELRRKARPVQSPVHRSYPGQHTLFSPSVVIVRSWRLTFWRRGRGAMQPVCVGATKQSLNTVHKISCHSFFGWWGSCAHQFFPLSPGAVTMPRV